MLDEREPATPLHCLATVHIPRLQFDDGVHGAILRTTRFERTIEQLECLMAEQGIVRHVAGVLPAQRSKGFDRATKAELAAEIWQKLTKDWQHRTFFRG